MKALLSLTVAAGLLITSTSSAAFCIKQYAAQMNRQVALSANDDTNFYNNKAKRVPVVANGGTVSTVQGHK